jgi:hypothetical protein
MRFSTILVLGGVLLGLPLQTASAQTMSYTDAIDAFAKACGGDIERHCKTVPLNEGKLFACMRSNEAKLSGNCKATVATTVASLDRRTAAQDGVLQACQSDLKRLCKEYDRGNGRFLRCLLKFEQKVSAPCNQAITDAGWR